MIVGIILGSAIMAGLGSLFGDSITKRRGQDRRKGRVVGSLLLAGLPNVAYLLSIFPGSQVALGTVLGCWGVHLTVLSLSAGLGAWGQAEEAPAASLFLSPAMTYLLSSAVSVVAFMYLTLI